VTGSALSCPPRAPPLALTCLWLPAAVSCQNAKAGLVWLGALVYCWYVDVLGPVVGRADDRVGLSTYWCAGMGALG
jgi:hypothetical protein